MRRSQRRGARTLQKSSGPATDRSVADRNRQPIPGGAVRRRGLVVAAAGPADMRRRRSRCVANGQVRRPSLPAGLIPDRRSPPGCRPSASGQPIAGGQRPRPSTHGSAWPTVDGATKVGRAIAGTSIAPRPVAAINGLASLALCLLVWMLWRRVDFSVAVGVAVGGYTVAAGWQLLEGRSTVGPRCLPALRKLNSSARPRPTSRRRRCVPLPRGMMPAETDQKFVALAVSPRRLRLPRRLTRGRGAPREHRPIGQRGMPMRV